MRTTFLAAALTLALSGCASTPYWTGPPGTSIPVVYDNPLWVPAADPQYVWESMVDVVDDYFKVDREEPVRAVGSVITEGRLETYPKLGATVFEPWDRDSANSYERWESTLQTIRRRATVRVMPGQGGYWIEVGIYKELEDLPQPEHSTSGAATLRTDTTLTRVINPGGRPEPTLGWIPQGRDPALEQRILAQIQGRFAVPLAPANRPAAGGY